MKTRVASIWERIRTSYWFVPGLMTAGSVALWYLMVWIEEPLKKQIVNHFGWIFGGGPEGAREVLSAIASSMITVTGVVFSITIVALTLASQQFGPRLLRHFIRDKGSQVVLGVFISTFLFCLLVLRTVRGTTDTTYVPHISVTIGVILAVVSVGFLIYYIHHVAQLIQAPHVVVAAARELEHSIHRVFPQEREERVAEKPEGEVFEVPQGSDSESLPVTVSESGYLEAVDEESLMEEATKRDLLVRLQFRAGDFVVAGSTIARVWPGDSLDEELEAKIRDSLLLGAYRTPTQDPGFLFDELAEMTVRSLSPSINDPFTAMNCTDHLSRALVNLGNRHPLSVFMRDEGGKLRIIRHTFSFEQAVNKTFGHIRQYSLSSAPVTNHLLHALRAIALLVHDGECRQELLRQAIMIRRGSCALPEEADRKEAEAAFEALMEVLNRDKR